MSWERVVLTREDLYNSVWTKPADTLAKELGLSGPGLAKICKKLAVPLPPRGYWAKRSAGHQVVQPVLPTVRPDTPCRHEFVRQESREKMNFSAVVMAALERERTPAMAVVVAQEIQDPHRLVSLSRGALWRSALRVRESVLPKRRCLDVVVSRDQLDRALRILDALIKGLEQRGYEVVATEPKPRDKVSYSMRDDCPVEPSKTGAMIGDAFVEFTLEERLEPACLPDRPAPDADFKSRWEWKEKHPGPAPLRATGRLALRICSLGFVDPPRRTWRDGKRQRLEDMLNEFIAGLIDVAERHRIWQERAERQRREWAEAERRRREEERRRELEQKRVADLEHRLSNWAKASAVEELVAAITSSDSVNGTGEWVAWAREHAARLRGEALSLAAWSRLTG